MDDTLLTTLHRRFAVSPSLNLWTYFSPSGTHHRVCLCLPTRKETLKSYSHWLLRLGFVIEGKFPFNVLLFLHVFPFLFSFLGRWVYISFIIYFQVSRFIFVHFVVLLTFSPHSTGILRYFDVTISSFAYSRPVKDEKDDYIFHSTGRTIHAITIR